MDDIIGISCMIFQKIACKLSCLCFLSLKTIHFIFNSAFIVTLPRPIHRLVYQQKKMSFFFLNVPTLLLGSAYNGSFSGPQKLHLLSGGAYCWKRLLLELYLILKFA